MRWQGLTSVIRPSVIGNIRRAQSKGVEGNLVGEGRLLGGLLVVDTGDAGVAFEHREAVSGPCGVRCESSAFCVAWFHLCMWC